MTEEQVGSRFYIPPECEAGRASEVSASSDLYSLGKVLYYLASGGKIFPRERHRDDQYDLAKVLENPFLEHISRILDRFVRESPSRGEAKTFRMLTEQARRKVTQRLPCPGVFETYVCNFCGHGTYVVAATSGNDSHNEGYGTEGSIGSQYMVFLECMNVTTVEIANASKSNTVGRNGSRNNMLRTKSEGVSSCCRSLQNGLRSQISKYTSREGNKRFRPTSSPADGQASCRRRRLARIVGHRRARSLEWTIPKFQLEPKRRQFAIPRPRHSNSESNDSNS